MRCDVLQCFTVGAFGQYVTFRAVCEWPNTTDTFKFKWEMRDLDSEASTVLSAPTEHLSATILTAPMLYRLLRQRM
jgi:hypothetical protein